jgi:undecaprenyl diphosphate synthase
LTEVTQFSMKTSRATSTKNAKINGCAVPNHVAIIMDGNGRWAKLRDLPRLDGHRAGTQNIHRVLGALEKHGVKYVTLFAFSTENWRRPSEEVKSLMAILEHTIETEAQTLLNNNVQLRYLGRMDRLPNGLQKKIARALELTKKNAGLILSMALDYGGRDEILQAVRRIIDDAIPSDKITPRLFESYLYTHDLPDPDIVVRTAGEQRLSNFLVWQSVYSEFYFSDSFWPDFNEEDLAQALQAFSQRKRSFGALVTED